MLKMYCFITISSWLHWIFCLYLFIQRLLLEFLYCDITWSLSEVDPVKQLCAFWKCLDIYVKNLVQEIPEWFIQNTIKFAFLCVATFLIWKHLWCVFSDRYLLIVVCFLYFLPSFLPPLSTLATLYLINIYIFFHFILMQPCLWGHKVLLIKKISGILIFFHSVYYYYY